jgi:serine/threonine-protein kinase RsbW
MQSVEETMTASGFGPKEVLEVQLAVEEACTNVIVHAFKGRSGPFWLSIMFEKDRLKIRIEDDGPFFDPTKHINATTTVHASIERPVGGWGIGLIRALMDEITYERRRGKNILILEKKLAM